MPKAQKPLLIEQPSTEKYLQRVGLTGLLLLYAQSLRFAAAAESAKV